MMGRLVCANAVAQDATHALGGGINGVDLMQRNPRRSKPLIIRIISIWFAQISKTSFNFEYILNA